MGPAGSGKTTLVEALLVSAGVLNRAGSVAEGTTVSDHDDAEIRQQRSVGLALAPLVHDGVKVNLLDAPGYADFVGEVRAGLRAADCAMFVVAANEGVDEADPPAVAGVRRGGHAASGRGDQARPRPRGLRRRSSRARRQSFGDKVVPVYLREGDDVVGLLTATTTPTRSSAGALIEGVIEESEDETLMERYVGGEEIDRDLLVQDLERAVARGSFYPVLPV